MSAKPNLKDVNGLELDRRVWAYDEERRVAEIALKGRLEGEWEWVEPKNGFVLYNDSPMLLNDLETTTNTHVTQVLANEPIQILWDSQYYYNKHVESANSTYIRVVSDGYLGWLDHFAGDLVSTVKLFFHDTSVDLYASHSVQALRSHIYMEPSIKCRIIHKNISFGSTMFTYTNSNNYPRPETWLNVEIQGAGSAYIHKSALEPSNLPPLEWVKQFLGTPYLWGGRTAWGIDCSGLSQMFYRYQNIYIPRDADQQEAAFAPVELPRAGDLAFFDGHVGILLERNERGHWRMLHANARHMSVTVDTLGEGEYGQYLSSIFHGYGRWEGEVGVYWRPK